MSEDSQNRGRSAAVHEVLERISKKLPPPPVQREPSPWEVLHALFKDRRMWFLVARIGISVLIHVCLFVVRGPLGFMIALALFVVGVGISMRMRRF